MAAFSWSLSTHVAAVFADFGRLAFYLLGGVEGGSVLSSGFDARLTALSAIFATVASFEARIVGALTSAFDIVFKRLLLSTN